MSNKSSKVSPSPIIKEGNNKILTINQQVENNGKQSPNKEDYEQKFDWEEYNNLTSKYKSEHGHRYRLNEREFFGSSSLSEYELLDKLGEGTFGVVHLARNKRTDQRVALKQILTHSEKEPLPITAIREIKILASLSHENILSIEDLVSYTVEGEGEYNVDLYMSLPYMDHDLSGLLSNPKISFSKPEIKCYMKQILEGIAYLHHNNIMHRDIKPANLLLNDKGILKVADFGLARSLLDPKFNRYTQSVVTRWYRPLELLLDTKHYDHAIDIWGVGCVFAQLLTGRPLCPGMNDMEQIELICKIMGTPDDSNWSGWRQLPGASKIDQLPYHKRSFDEKFSTFDRHTVDLLEKMLCYDPIKRISAIEALEHSYFHSQPYPLLPSELPKYESCHEMVQLKKNADTKAKLPNVNNLPPPNRRNYDNNDYSNKYRNNWNNNNAWNNQRYEPYKNDRKNHHHHSRSKDRFNNNRY